MMKNFLFFLFICLISCKKPEFKTLDTIKFFIGTYTNGESEGIYKYKIDSEGKLSKIGLVAKTNNPSFLAKSKDGNTLIAVSEEKGGVGYVESYLIQKDSLLFKSKSKSGGANPCFVTVNENNLVLVANYSGGNIGYLQIDNLNRLSNLLDVQQHFGKGTTKRQKAPHAHSVWFNPNNQDVISVDLGTNELWFSNIINNKFAIKQNQKTLKMKEGAGPRHLTFHPNKQWIYVLNELDNTISLVKQEKDIYLTESTISMLPEGFSKFSKAADIHISNDGKFLYASNRGHNSIVVYNVNPDNGSLKIVGFENVKGVSPRNFSLTPDNKYLIVANQDSNTIASFKRDFYSGKLTFVDKIEAFAPVCILF